MTVIWSNKMASRDDCDCGAKLRLCVGEFIDIKVCDSCGYSIVTKWLCEIIEPPEKQ